MTNSTFAPRANHKGGIPAFAGMTRVGGRRACEGQRASGTAARYFSFRQFTEPRFSTVLDSISMSKPLRSRYFRVITWPVPSRETP